MLLHTLFQIHSQYGEGCYRQDSSLKKKKKKYYLYLIFPPT